MTFILINIFGSMFPKHVYIINLLHILYNSKPIRLQIFLPHAIRNESKDRPLLREPKNYTIKLPNFHFRTHYFRSSTYLLIIG